MPDYSLPPCVTLVFGRSGTGKTTFAFLYLVNALTEQPLNGNPAACVFIFDWKLEASQRLGVPSVGTVAQCEAALAGRIVCFNPHVMFQPEEGKAPAEDRALRWFAAWAFEVSRRGPGKKILYVDELRQFVKSHSAQLPPEIERVTRQGRSENLELLSSTQYPKDYARTIRESVTEWVCFNINDPDEIDSVRPYFPGVEAVADLKLGEFISCNRESGAEMRGKLF